MSSTGGGGAGGTAAGFFAGAGASFAGFELLAALPADAGFFAPGFVVVLAAGLAGAVSAARTGSAHNAAQAAARDRARVNEANMAGDSTRPAPIPHNLPI